MVIGETIGWKCPATELPKTRSVLSWAALCQMSLWQRPNETESYITVVLAAAGDAPQRH